MLTKLVGYGLTGRPGQCTISQQVHVDMKYGLTGFLITVHHQPVPVIVDTSLVRDILRGTKKFTHDHLVIVDDVINRRDMFFRDNKKMYRSLGINIIEGEHVIIFKNDIGRYFAISYLAE
jgi:hypothetical protein